MISCRGTLAVIGLVDASGGGGFGGATSLAGTTIAPGGGGSGGTVVLQGLDVVVTGRLFANGGGGGGGGNALGLGGTGVDGTRSITCAPGGTAGSSGGAGGFGGCVNVVNAGDGKANTNPGAGGGSAGFLLTYTPAGVEPMLNPLEASPAFSPNGTIGTN